MAVTQLWKEKKQAKYKGRFWVKVLTYLLSVCTTLFWAVFWIYCYSKMLKFFIPHIRIFLKGGKNWNNLALLWHCAAAPVNLKKIWFQLNLVSAAVGLYWHKLKNLLVVKYPRTFSPKNWICHSCKKRCGVYWMGSSSVKQIIYVFLVQSHKPKYYF